jgi:hypothetical protein
MKRKSTLDEKIQVEAKIAFRQLRLEISQLERTYRQLRPEPFHDMPPLDLTVIRTLLHEATRLRAQLTIWPSVVEGHRPVQLIYARHKLDRALTVPEIDLEWERQLATATRVGALSSRPLA